MHLRSAVRSVLRMPSFAVAVVLTIALGVGASSAMFSIVYATLLRPLPYPDADRLVVIWEKWQVGRDLKGVDPAVAARLHERTVVMDRALPTWRVQNHVFEDIAGFSSYQFSLTGTDHPEQLEGLVVTSQFFRVLGVRPAVGRALHPEEDRLGRDEVVLIGHRLWMRRFGGDPHLVGKTIGVDGMPHTVVGIMGADFHLALPDTPRDPDIIAPVPHSYLPDFKWALLMTVARLKPGVAIPVAQADMSAVVRHMAETSPRYKTRDANVVPLRDEVGRDSRPALLVLFGATVCVLLIGCANVANLLLLRAAARQKELAIRTSLGAGRWLLARQLVAESIVLAAIGGIAGLVAAYWGTAALVAFVPEHLFPRLEDVKVDPIVLAFGFAVAVAVGVVSGLAPAWRILRGEGRRRTCETLNDAQRAATIGRGQRTVRRALVTAQVGIAMVLLVGAGLLTETYVRLTRVDLGVNPTRVLTFRVSLPQARYSSDASRLAFQDRLLARLAALPRVQSAGLTTSLPVGSQDFATVSAAVEGRPRVDGEFTSIATVSPGEIQVMLPPGEEVQRVIEIKPNPHFSAGGVDAALQSSPASTLAAVTLGTGFDGLGTTFPGFTMTGEPSDANLSVGAAQVVQWVNSMYAVFDKATGSVQFGPTNGNTPWQRSSIANGRCASDNSGDPIVLYDKQNQRWIFTQFAVSKQPYYQCIAVSTGTDARGPYNLYAASFSRYFNDYPKVGVFDGNYYFTFNLFRSGVSFSGADICVVPGANVRAGTAASMTCTNLGTRYGGVLPADVDGASGASGTTAPPPAGTSEYFLNFGSNSLNVWRMTASGAVSGPVTIPVAAFSTACGGGTCIPQAGTSQQLDSLGDRLMYRVSYRNFGTYVSLLVNHSVSGNGAVGVRWYELRDTGSGLRLYQQGTFAPDSNYRWMGSIAQDKQGNIAVGYSVSGKSIDAGISFSSRAPADQLGILGNEQTVLTSRNFQSGHSRWGDYTSMSVDPADDCTIWYTNQYMPASGDFKWATHINNFKLGSCQ